MQRKKLPIGIQTFREIRESHCYYVDKTPFALRLLNQGKYFFLSRPRHFGKSLLLDTRKELFEGNAALFTGLLGSLADLGQCLDRQLTVLEQQIGLPVGLPDSRSRFAELIRRRRHLESAQSVPGQHLDLAYLNQAL